jgi:hypothetical protein
MSPSDRQAAEQNPVTAFTVFWNTVLPALALALILGAPMALAFAIAGAATSAIVAAFAARRRHAPGRTLAQPRVFANQ